MTGVEIILLHKLTKEKQFKILSHGKKSIFVQRAALFKPACIVSAFKELTIISKNFQFVYKLKTKM